jgi:hypothetical protein
MDKVHQNGCAQQGRKQQQELHAACNLTKTQNSRGLPGGEEKRWRNLRGIELKSKRVILSK